MAETQDSPVKEKSEADIDNDNTVSEELSRYSSPSQSQSSSCTSITNPFYDGPQNVATEVKDEAHRGNRRTSGNTNRRRNTADEVSNPSSLNSQADQASRVATEEKLQQRVIIFWDLGYLLTCAGLLQFVQLVSSTNMKVIEKFLMV